MFAYHGHFIIYFLSYHTSWQFGINFLQIKREATGLPAHLSAPKFAPKPKSKLSEAASIWNGGSAAWAGANFKKSRSKRYIACSDLVRLKGFEPPTFWFVAKHSIQLSYSRIPSAEVSPLTA